MVATRKNLQGCESERKSLRADVHANFVLLCCVELAPKCVQAFRMHPLYSSNI